MSAELTGPRIRSNRTSRTSPRIGTSCHKTTANQFRLLIHTAAYWLLHMLRDLPPKASFWRVAQFDTIRFALIEVAGRITEMATRIKVTLPSSYPDKESFMLLSARAAKLPP